MRKTIKRLGAVLLAMAMVVSVLCTGALAADTYSITVKSDTSHTLGLNHTFNAYQIFAGTLTSDSTGTGSDSLKLGINDWGKNIKSGTTDHSTELLTKLQSDDIKSLIQAFNDIALFRYASTISPEPVTLSELEKAVRVFISDNLFQAADHINLISVSPCTTVNLDSSRLVSAIGCIIRNAVEASDFSSETSSPVNITLMVTDHHNLCAEITNSGCCPSPDIADTMFEPFCTNRQEHLGLGLAIAAETADAMGGTISWEHDNGITTFRLNVRI